MLISDADADSFKRLRSRAHCCWFASNVLARVLISNANADTDTDTDTNANTNTNADTGTDTDGLPFSYVRFVVNPLYIMLYLYISLQLPIDRGWRQLCLSLPASSEGATSVDENASCDVFNGRKLSMAWPVALRLAFLAFFLARTDLASESACELRAVPAGASACASEIATEGARATASVPASDTTSFLFGGWAQPSSNESAGSRAF